MNYRYLPEQLRPTADAVASFLRETRGLQHLRVEEEIDKNLPYRPTLHQLTQDKYFLCVDVLDSPFSPTLESVVSDCMQRSLPVKLFVAFPGGADMLDYKKNVDRARVKGVGVIEVTNLGCDVKHEALALSLIGVRPIDKKLYPPKYRSSLTDAEMTFRNGNPSKGCSVVYDEIENLSRAIAKKTKAKNLWRAPRAGERPPRVRLDTGAWEKVMDALLDWLDWGRCHHLKHALQGVQAIIPHRNESGHKPSTVAKRTKRDTELKTRFEAAGDLLRDLIVAAKPLHL
jgi:hypothetical protein